MPSNDVVRGNKILVRHPGSYANAKVPFPVTPPIQAGPKRHDASVARLLEDATKTKPLYDRLFAHWKSSASAATYEHYENGASTPRSATSMGPLKKKERVVEKCEADYKTESIPAGACIDIVRATLAFDSAGDILKCLETILSGEDLNGYGYRVAQAKQLFDMGKGSDPLFSLYGDIKLSLLLFAPGVPDGHVCELQLNTVALIAAKGARDGHHQYEWERDAINKWDREYAGKRAFKFSDIVYDYMNWSAEPSTTEYEWYTTGKSGQYSVKKWYDDFYRSYIASAENTGPARVAFDSHPDSGKLIDFVNTLKGKVSTRWLNRYKNNQNWVAL